MDYTRALCWTSIIVLVAYVVTLSTLLAQQRTENKRQAPKKIVHLKDIVKTSTYHSKRDKSKILFGYVDQPDNARLEPEIIIGAYINGKYTGLRMSSMWSGLYIPGNTDPYVDLAFEVKQITICGTLKPVETQERLLFKRVQTSTQPYAGANTSIPVLGLGAQKTLGGKYMCPLLQEMVNERLPVGWSLGQQYAEIALTLTIPQGKCFSYCWTPMEILSDGQYLIKLQPSTMYPYTSAIIGIGKWLSIVPGISEAFEPIALRTSSGCDITLRTGTYKRAQHGIVKPDQVILGASAGLENNLFAIDIQNFRFGIVLAVS